MSYRYDINTQDNFVQVNIWGVDTQNDVLERMNKIISDSNWKPGMGVLMDMSKVETLDVSFEDSWKIKEAHKLMEQLIGNARIALIAQTELVYGIGRMWQSMSEELNFELEIFEDPELAHKWITG